MSNSQRFEITGATDAQFRANGKAASPDGEECLPAELRELRATVQALRASEAKYQDLYDNAPDMYCSVDAVTGLITECNRTLLEKTGYRREEVLGRPVLECYAPESLDAARACQAQFRETGEVRNVELRLLRKDGERLDVSLSVTAVRDDNGCIISSRSTWRDISRLREAEQARRNSEEQLELITNALPALISYIDADYRYQRANRTYERWFGIPAEQVRGRHVRDVLGEVAWERVRPRMERALAGEEITYEEELPYRGAGPRWVNVTYTPDRDADGTVRGFAVLVHDITQQKQVERDLADREHEFRAMFELAGSGKSQADVATGRFTRVNRRFCQITGYSEAELLERTSRDITHPEDRDADIARVVPALRGETDGWTSEKRYLRKDGRVVWVLVTGSVIRDEQGRPTQTVATIHDITERKRAEAALRDSERRLRLALDAGRLGDWSWNAADDRVLFSSRAAEIFGVPPGESVPTWTQMQGWLLDGDGPRAAEAVQRAIDTRSDYAIEYRVRRPVDGREVWIAVHGRADYAADGRVLGMVGVVQDVTEQWEAEEALREANRRKDEFLAMLAHELRNPLAPIRTAVAILEARGAADSLLQRQGDIIKRQAEHMARLVSDLLDVSRITRGVLTVERKELDLVDLIRNCVEDYRVSLENAGLHLEMHVPEGPMVMLGDAVRLCQAIGNLLMNARRFTPEGGKVTLRLQQETREGLVYGTVRVRDSGTGIPAEMIPQIWETFVQGEQDLARTRGGLGLGLALVKGIADLHGGEVSAWSAGPGQGAEFTLALPLISVLPAAAPHSGTSPATTYLPAPAGGVCRILVIEDNHDAAETMIDLLEVAGYQVRVAHDGAEGVETARAWRPHVVLTDIGLPGMDGYAVAAALRQEPATAGVGLVALSGYAHPEDIARGKSAGFDEYLAKPVEPAALMRVLGSLASPHQ